MTYSNINLDDLTNDEIRDLATEMVRKVLEFEEKLANSEQLIVCLNELLSK